ncbi:MAG: TRAP transporter large permease subunit [Proteobacteria bacterium]|nr:TRAP transporter large permease subunit [Pseudomonadota bacterium]MBU4577124.1 TRAP transporter large permease subunit [Pseudomonadota bacterium]MBV1717019.1 TRAP transporter large permease subunit [Desulfarculus sp.]
MAPEIIGLLGIVLLFVLMAIGMPISFALIIPSIFGYLIFVGWDSTMTGMISVLSNYVSNYTMSVIPVFIFMGQIAYLSGLMEELYTVSEKWLGRLPGGLAISTVFANGFFAACSGSSLAACIVIGNTAIPQMKKQGYHPYLTYGVVAAAGTLAALIPPSIIMCIYGLLVDQSITDLFIGGILPGILSVLLYSAYILFRARKFPRSTERYTFKEKVRSVGHLWVVVLLLISIIYSIYFGWATPTEAGAVGAVVVMLLALFTKKLTVKIFFKAVATTVKTTGMILLIICAAAFFGRFLILAGTTEFIVKSVVMIDASRYVVFALIGLVYMILGCFLSATGMMVISLPIFYPIMMKLGFDPVWFGIIVVIFVEMALITPPVGMNIYAVSSIDTKVPIATIIKGAAFFLSMDVLTVIILTIFPQIVTFLPNLMR